MTEIYKKSDTLFPNNASIYVKWGKRFPGHNVDIVNLE